ncbi:hypothetical protein JNUCC64_13455 [Streptomyces sp. JNUCC 64]
MRAAKIASTLVAPCLALAVLGVGSPAMANTDPGATQPEPVATEAPAVPEEPDLTEGAPDVNAPAEPGGEYTPPVTGVPKPGQPAPDEPHGRPCEPGYSYTATSKGKDYHRGVGAEQANYNGTSHTANSAFTSETAGEVGIAVKGELKVSGSVLVLEVEGAFGVELSTKLSTKIGNTIRVKTPPRKTTFARYGVYRMKSAGYSQYTYANCTKGVKYPSTTYTPRRVGWAIWEK